MDQTFLDGSCADVERKEINKTKRNKLKRKAKQKGELMLVAALGDSCACHLH